jgi:ribosome-associated protein
MNSARVKKISKRSLPPEIKAAVQASQAKKGEEICVLDLRGVASFTDFFIIMHGKTFRQNVALSESIEQELKNSELRPIGVEGAARGEWILMDYGNFVVHIFSKHAREYYSLEKLWGDAPKLTY